MTGDSGDRPSEAAAPPDEPGPALVRQRRMPRWGWWALSLAGAGVLGGLVGGLLVDAAHDNGSGCNATSVAGEVLPSVVTVVVVGRDGTRSNGTGALVRSDGYVLTNEHVVSTAVEAGAEVTVQYSDGTESDATIVGVDAITDLAVIRAEDGADGRALLDPSRSALRVGQPVVALGAPLGLSNTVTAGIVSALGRYVPVPTGDGRVAHLLDAVQTDAAINPGNSGGPLVDCSGRQVGVNTAISTVPNSEGVGGGGSVGLGFAIPISVAGPVADELIEHGRANHPVLGLAARVVTEDPERPPNGLEVTAVAPGGPAEAAGLAPGDLLTEIDGEKAVSTEQLVLATLRHDAGDTIRVGYRRGGDTGSADITLAPAP
ncbi:PDZ domain-containing protein [Nocardioides guangzhouensis]|uniref:PDZ domain-containing protein n=1 Tax=Nocardioides guangzhouensis TaxID=2497878 RepID=A0A4Q4Z316_9ACTN|nr:trypsin-like peptidase domain-containing protein [Nocardioides guangzhouensis]RYP81615.1 PDZ domain-containing protein [Nocardioides guangzhouensis]